MDVGSTFNIYGNLFGWQIFDLIFDFMAETGLWVLPFLIMLYNAFMARDEGNRYDPVSALISIELKAYIAIVLIIVFLIPSVSANKLLFIYDSGSEVQKAGDTGTTFDQFADDLSDEVRIPFGWYAILYASTGFTNVMKQMLPTGDHARQIMYQLQQASMDDPELQRKLEDFESRCSKPAKARMTEIMTRYPNSQIAQKFNEIHKTVSKDVKDSWWTSKVFLGSDNWKIAPMYPGNQYFMDYLYNDQNHGSVKPCKVINLRENKMEDPNTSLCIPPTSFALNPAGNATCQDMWKGGFAGWGNGIVDELQDYYEQAGYSIQNEDSFVYARMTSGNLNVDEKGIGNKEGDWGQWFSEKWGALTLNIGQVFTQFFNSVIRFYLPIVMGVITLLFIMLLPLLITFGRYQMSTVASLAITYFGIAFLPGIWHIAAWVDQVMLVTIYGHKGIVEGLFSMQKAVIDMVALSVYVLFTWLWIGFMREMGSYASHAITSTGNQALSGAGASRDSGKEPATRGIKNTGRHGVSVANKTRGLITAQSGRSSR